MGTDCIGSCRSNYHTITPAPLPILNTNNYIHVYLYYKLTLKSHLDEQILHDDNTK